MHRMKTYIAVFLAAILLLLAIQNMGRVELTFLLWSFETRRFVMIGLCFVTGFIIGWIAKTVLKKQRNDDTL